MYLLKYYIFSCQKQKINTKLTISDFEVVVDTVVMVLYLKGLKLESDLPKLKAG